ncbi:CHASE2 domain-containing protein [Leptothermofonsia sp. ETS-13]|uniref:CHASE2 domain-containing protein n=1 Tax=Leptothermofonsia sp. ETS-13 TaxID=3035696 RepID=UPI003BA0B797
MSWRIDELGWRILPGSLVSIAFAILLSLGSFQPLEQIAYNALFRLRGERSWDDRLVVIAIDDASIKQLGRFPWNRQRYTQLLNVLNKAKPSVVAFNLILSESSSDDPQLAEAIVRNSQVVLAQGWDHNGLLLFPVPDLQKAAIATGHILKQQDTDGLTRKIDLYIQGVPAFSLSIIQAYSLVQATVPPPNSNQPFWINWAGQIQHIRQFAFADVIEEKISLHELKGKIVLVGVTAAGIDSLATPFDRNPPASGVYFHTAVVNNLLQQNPLQPLPAIWLPLILLLGGPGLSLLLSHQREERQALMWAAVCLGWGAVVFCLFHLTHWLPLAFPLCLVTTTAGAVFVRERLRMGTLLDRQVQQLWQTYRHDLVAHQQMMAGFGLHQTMAQTSFVQSATQLAALAEQLGRSQSTQAAIARSLSMGLLAADWDGWVWFCNPIASDWLGIQVGNDLSTHLVPEWLTEKEWQTDLHMLKQQEPVPPHELHWGDRWFALKLEPLVYCAPKTQAATESSPLDGLLLVLEDITTRKQAETALEKQVEELQQVAQLKDDFLSTVSHELRSPMANMKMAIELLKIAKSKEAADHYLKILQTECDREIELIEDLLDLQRLEAGAQTHTISEIDLQNWLSSILAPFHERAENQQQTLQVHLPPQLSPLRSDQVGLKRIIVELVNNACKYTPAGETITVAVSLPDTAHPLLQIRITNSGTDIPASELSRIFEKFYRVPKADPWKRGGTGLGLALVKKLVESLKGTIHVQSGSGQTSFIVQLPLYSDSHDG